MKKIKVEMSAKEKAWYIITSAVAIIGLAFVVLGIIGDLLSYGNPLQKVSDSFFLPWRYFGLIILAVAVVVLVLALSINAKKTDRAADKALRRQQRLEAMKVEAPAEPVEAEEVK